MLTPLRILFYSLFITLSVVLHAQDDPTPNASVDQILRVGVVDAPPYCYQDAQGNWTGLSIDFWRRLAEAEQLRYEFVELNARDSLLPLVGGRVDALAHAAVTPDGEEEVDFLQIHHTTPLAIARPGTNSIMNVVSALFSMRFLWIVASLSALLLLIGALVYFLERDGNEDQFGGDGSTIRGIGSGFWWAGVTLTTIGYGDKAPATLAGRIVAMLWMLLAMGITASLTAAIVSAIGSRSSVSFPEDLRDQRLGAIEMSAAADYLEAQGYTFEGYQLPVDGLRDLKDGKLDYFVEAAYPLEFANRDNASIRVGVQRTNARPQGYAVALPKDSPLTQDLIDDAVRIILSESWRERIDSYVQEKQN